MNIENFWFEISYSSKHLQLLKPPFHLVWYCTVHLFPYQVLAFHPDENWFSESEAVTAKTFETPPAPVNILPRNTSLQLEWRAPLHIRETSFWFELREVKIPLGFSPVRPNLTHLVKQEGGRMYMKSLSGLFGRGDISLSGSEEAG